jgi:amino acid transporter
VSLPGLVLYGLGTTIGAGIYALTGVVAGRAGMQAPAAFAVASVLALFSALSFGELAARYPHAGGEAIYVFRGLRRRDAAVAVGVMAVAAGVISAATISVGFTGYLASLLPVPRLLAAALVVLALGAVAAWGIRESIFLVGLVTLIEVGGLVAVLAWGHAHLAELPARAGELVPLSGDAWLGVTAASVIAFYAFIGFEDIVNVAEEVRDPRRTLPRAVLLTLVVTVVLYSLVVSIAVLAVPPAELAASEAPLALVFERCGGSARVLGLVALAALLNGALIQIVKSARVLYGLAAQGLLPAPLARVHPRTRTPLLPTALVTAVCALLAISFPLETLAEATSEVTLAVFALANLSLVLVKRRGEEAASGTLRVPLWVPAIGCAVSFGLLGIRGAQAFFAG